MSDGGKGDTPRPLSVEHSTFAANWDLIFKKPVVPAVDNPLEVNPDDLRDRPGQDVS